MTASQWKTLTDILMSVFLLLQWSEAVAQRGAQAHRIFRGLAWSFGGVKCSCKAELAEEMGTGVSGGAAGGGHWHLVKMPQGARAATLGLKVPSRPGA